MIHSRYHVIGCSWLLILQQIKLFEALLIENYWEYNLLKVFFLQNLLVNFFATDFCVLCILVAKLSTVSSIIYLIHDVVQLYNQNKALQQFRDLLIWLCSVCHTSSILKLKRKLWTSGKELNLICNNFLQQIGYFRMYPCQF